ncbi:MAG: ferritin-like domain-containing protein [Proteobacteria bacterium]|nr:ferritin-like domain-containing protein [Pseudomonadota bacterium]
MSHPSLPEEAQVDATIKHIIDHAPRTFVNDYERARTELVTLYNKGVRSQWDSVNDLDWSTDVDPEKLVQTTSQPHPTLELVRAAAEVKGSPFAKWTEKEFTKLGIEIYMAQLSQFMHGEQGAMMAAAKIVEVVPWIDAKYYAATQTMDEARHTEVFSRYLFEKLGDAYSINPYLETQITTLMEDGRWDITYLGMQVIIESLALAAFGSLLDTVEEPLLQKLLRYVLADEARHVAFGVLSLREYYQELTDAELKDRQEYLAENTLNSRNRVVDPQLWERAGVDIVAALPSLREAASKQGRGRNVYAAFNRGFLSKLVPNARKIGLIDANDGYLRRLWGEAGLLKFEFADDTASDYETYDFVAQDRAAAAAGDLGGQQTGGR